MYPLGEKEVTDDLYKGSFGGVLEAEAILIKCIL